MFENMTYEELLKSKLALVDDSLDKREGSIIYDTLAPNSAESSRLYADMDIFADRMFADTAIGDDLERRTAERNIKRNSSVNAVFKGYFYDTDGNAFDISIGDRFQGGTMNYNAVKKLDKGVFSMQCETPGSEGNSYTGKIIPVEYIDGLATAEISEIITYGEDAEDDNSLRKRYFNSFDTNSFGGNIDDYKNIVSQIDSVGGCKVFPVYYGAGTVRLVLINNGYEIPDDDIINEVQELIDPKPKGSGYGKAPIGHDVYVEAAKGKTINVSASLTISDGYDKDTVFQNAIESIKDYFLQLAKEWGQSDSLTVRISRIEMKILDTDGVIDVENVSINSAKENIVLDSDCIPILGTAVFE
ncbi:MAG: baseplate J/gp47 family protein [Clostridia bacterium]|jgi:uncharacterized phage protein gp47/JayE|nr:baseplate J/gp47 family protein [Clostridia bacterium]MCI2000054.1 baseplate J/gp47 family protein [Clostridia bacterium]MCI2014412.1 baseplate J/gp47 family protein [Clostridia bacterium]